MILFAGGNEYNFLKVFLHNLASKTVAFFPKSMIWLEFPTIAVTKTSSNYQFSTLDFKILLEFISQGKYQTFSRYCNLDISTQFRYSHFVIINAYFT